MSNLYIVNNEGDVTGGLDLILGLKVMWWFNSEAFMAEGKPTQLKEQRIEICIGSALRHTYTSSMKNVMSKHTLFQFPIYSILTCLMQYTVKYLAGLCYISGQLGSFTFHKRFMLSKYIDRAEVYDTGVSMEKCYYDNILIFRQVLRAEEIR